MSWRTVIISNQAKLDYKMGYLVIRSIETKRILIDEIAILLIENPMVSITGVLIEKLIEKKVRVIFCDSKHDVFFINGYSRTDKRTKWEKRSFRSR